MTSPSRIAAWACCAVISVQGCAPALDWRDSNAAGTRLQLQFPCRPVHQQRDRVALAGVSMKMELLSCSAGSLTWGLSYADVGDPREVDAALRNLQDSAVANIAAVPAERSELAVPGATPQARSGRSRLAGRTPKGEPVQMQTVVFAQGTWVFQASVLGTQVHDDTADIYFASLRFAR